MQICHLFFVFFNCSKCDFEQCDFCASVFSMRAESFSAWWTTSSRPGTWRTTSAMQSREEPSVKIAGCCTRRPAGQAATRAEWNLTGFPGLFADPDVSDAAVSRFILHVRDDTIPRNARCFNCFHGGAAEQSSSDRCRGFVGGFFDTHWLENWKTLGIFQQDTLLNSISLTIYSLDMIKVSWCCYFRGNISTAVSWHTSTQ